MGEVVVILGGSRTEIEEEKIRSIGKRITDSRKQIAFAGNVEDV